MQNLVREVSARQPARLSYYASLDEVYREAKHWCWETTTKKSILHTLYLPYMRDRSEQIANEWYTFADSCSRIQLYVLFKEDWPIEEVMYLDLIGRARMIEGYNARFLAQERRLNAGADVRESVPGEQWMNEWRRKTEGSGK
jgi:hypothetical protein